MSLGSGSVDVLLFVGSMFGGMYLFRLFDDWLAKAAGRAEAEDADERVCAE